MKKFFFAVLTLVILFVSYIIYTQSSSEQRKREFVKETETMIGITIKYPRWFYRGISITGFDFQTDNKWYYSIYITDQEIVRIQKIPLTGNPEGVVDIYKPVDTK
jgi:uncharacterized protein YpmS